MSKYIDADKTALAVVKATTYGGALRAVREQPTIDLDDYVPKDFHDKTCEAMAKAHQEEIADMARVVRCKECKWAEVEGRTTHYLVCQRHPYSARAVDLTDFCSEGKRKESE